MKNKLPWNRTVLSGAVALVLGTIYTGNLLAACPGTVSGTEGACTLTATESVTVDNSGSVSAGGGAGITVDATSTGVSINNSGLIYGDLFGIFLESGQSDTSITNHASGTISAPTTAIRYDADLSGSLNNSGLIRATSGNSGSAYGLLLGDITGSINNSGTISTTMTASNSWAAAHGIAASTVLGSASIDNSGDIISHAEIIGNNNIYAEAYGMILGPISGNVSNSGTISLSATGNSWAGAFGIEGLTVSAGGSVTNSGTIYAHAIANTGNAGVFGADLFKVEGYLSNSGTINVQATAPNKADVHGWHGWLTSGTLNNSGTINVVANAGTEAEVFGLSTWDTITSTGVLANSGTITVAGNGGDHVHAYGIYSYLNNNGTLSNSGTITVTAADDNGGIDAFAYGIYVDNPLAGLTFSNSGTISASTNSADAYAYSVYVDNGAGITFTNSNILNGSIYLSDSHMVNTGELNIPSNVVSSYIDGNYTQTGSGIYNVGVTSATDYATLDVTGTFDVSANDLIGLTVEGAIQDGDFYDDVLTAGILTTSGALTVVDNSALFSFAAVKDGNNIDINVAQDVTLAQVAASTIPSAVGVAGALDTIAASGPTGDLATLINTLYSLGTTQQVSNAIGELVPAMDGSVSTITAESIRALSRAIRSRLHTRGGLSSGDPQFSDRNFWIKPFYNDVNQDSHDDVPGYDMDAWGIAFGADADISSTWRVGVAGAYTRSEFDRDFVSGSNKVDADTFQVGLYGDYKFDESTTLKLQGTFGWSDYDSKRRITFLGETAKADFDSTHFRFTADYEMTSAMSASTDVTYKIFGDYTYVDVDSYNESGSIASLSVRSDTADELIIGVGAQWDHKLTQDSVLSANAELGYDLLADRTKLGASFVAPGGPAFTTRGLDPDPVVFRGGLGYSILNDNGVEVIARYDLEAREDFTDQAFSVNVRWRF